MQYWRDDYFKTLVDIAADAAKSPDWADYAAFCLEYESGLRPQAFAVLERFMHALERAQYSERRRFVSWLMNTADGTPGQHLAVPHPLRLRIVEPTLSDPAISAQRLADTTSQTISPQPSSALTARKPPAFRSTAKLSACPT